MNPRRPSLAMVPENKPLLEGRHRSSIEVLGRGTGVLGHHLAKAPAMKLLVGQASLQGGIRRYPFDLLELLVEPGLPRPAKLAAFREARKDRVFSLRLPPDAIAPGSGREAVIERAIGSAEALEAEWIVVTTNPTTTPTGRNEGLLRSLVERVQADGRRIAWEPRGVWQPQEAERWADTLGVTLVRDLSREDPPPGEVVYTRLRALGFGARIGPSAVERVAARLEGANEAFVVIEGQGAARARVLLSELLDEE